MKLGIVVGAMVLAIAGAAAAAWIVFSPTSSGSAAGAIATTSTENMISFATGTGASVAAVPCTAGTGDTCTGGTPGVIPVAVTNNDPSNAHAASGVTVTLTSPACASHLFVTGTSNLTESVPAGGTNQDATVTFVADPSTPTTCTGAPVTAHITGSAA